LSSPLLDTSCPRHAPCSVACRLQHEQPTWFSPPAHTAACPWHSPRSPSKGAAETQLLCVAPFTAVTHPPLSPRRSASAHRTPRTRRWQCESRSDVGFSMSRSRWSTALGRGTYGGCVVGDDGQGLLRTLHRQVRRLLARRAASPNPDGRFEHARLHRYTASTARRRDTLE
jgi:hypothetical protein